MTSDDNLDFGVPAFDVVGAVAVLNQTLEYALPNMRIVGELASFKIAKNQWVYADIKDDYAKLRLFGTIYNLPGPLEDGMTVEVVARPQIHPQYNFSLNIISIRPVGEGHIKKAADLLKAKLDKEGLFDPSRKRLIPHPPARIGLIASVQSAAYADFIKIMDERWSGVNVEVYDAHVQGEKAEDDIVRGLKYFNERLDVDVVVLTRGGGSADDLAVFSVEQVVREVSASRVPTCVAVGHEVDTSLAELAADMRASTPSNAAELLFPDKEDMRERIRQNKFILDNLLTRRLEGEEIRIARARTDLAGMVEEVLARSKESVEQSKKILEMAHPKTAMKRGFVLVQAANGKLVSSVGQLQVDDNISMTLADGKAELTVTKLDKDLK